MVISCRTGGEVEKLSVFFNDISYFNTFGGNPVVAAAGLTVLDVIEE